MWTVSSSVCVRVCVGSVCVLSDFLFFFLASLPVFLWLTAKWHKKQTDTYYAEHQRRALEGVHPREAYPATHNYTLIQLNQRRDGENRLDLWLSTPADLQDILNVFTKPTHTDSCAPVITQQHSPKPGWMILTVSFRHFFFYFFFYFTRSEETVRMRFTHGLPRISWLTWLARQTVLARKSPGTNRTHVAHVPFLSLSPPGAHIACHPFLRKRERGQKISGY